MNNIKSDDIPMMKQIEAEKIAMYQNFANKRLLIALISVIVGFIIYATIFVVGYTVREQHWLATIERVKTPTTEVANGVQQNTDNTGSY